MGDTTQVKSQKVKEGKVENDEEETQTSQVKVTLGGLRPPRLWNDNFKASQIEYFCSSYDAYRERIDIANEDGGARNPATMRELVAIGIQDLVCFEHYDGKSRNTLTEKELKTGLYRMAGIDEPTVDIRKFKMDMFISYEWIPSCQCEIEYYASSTH